MLLRLSLLRGGGLKKLSCCPAMEAAVGSYSCHVGERTLLRKYTASIKRQRTSTATVVTANNPIVRSFSTPSGGASSASAGGEVTSPKRQAQAQREYKKYYPKQLSQLIEGHLKALQG